MAIFKIAKVRVWLPVLLLGIFCGLLLAVRLNLLPSSKADISRGILGAAEALENSFIRVASEVGPGVVSISTEHTEVSGPGSLIPFFGFGDDDFFFDRFFKDFFGEIPGGAFKQRGLGSGFIIDEEGYILTNQHVIEDADKITVTLADGRRFDAEVKGSDIRSDLAVIKIDAQDLPALKLGDSDQVKIGQWAIAVGNPYGFAVGSAEPTVTAGIVSALNRSLPQSRYEQRSYVDLIQTDAAINPGNSGGPLVNLKGEVIGINVAIFSPSGGNIGIGFAIPVNKANEILAKLIAGKKILHGWLGVTIQDLNEGLAEYLDIPDQKGAVVLNVLADSPAERAGLEEGDVIIKFEGKKVDDVRSLLREVAKKEVGDTVRIQVIRDKESQNLRLKIGERPKDIEETIRSADLSWRGMDVAEITPDLTRRYRLEATSGVVVTKVDLKSSAYEAGLLAGDVIVAINRKRIKTIEDYESVMKTITGDALIRTERGFVVLKSD